MTQISKKNHFVPKFYLKAWQSSPNKIWAYRRLVENKNVPFWSEKSIEGIAYHQHLYTQIKPEGESDEIEKWMCDQYETPAKLAIEKATTNGKLSANDWRKIVRFFVLQDKRSVKDLLKHLDSWKAGGEMHNVLEKETEKIPEMLENHQHLIQNEKEKEESIKNSSAHENFPMRIEEKLKNGGKSGSWKIDVFIGRNSWLQETRHLLKETAEILHNHRWTIIRPAKGMFWPTSDNPAIKLNFCNDKNYDFKGGWNKKDGDLLLPLSPEYLLFTHMGDKRPWQRNTRVSVEETNIIRKIILNNSHRIIFSHLEDSEIPKLVSRRIGAQQCKIEKEQWDKFHEEHSKAEKEFLKDESEG